MVAVHDEVGLAELVDDNGRKVPAGERPLHLPQPLADVGSTGVELAVEVAAPAVRPDDLAQRDGAKSEVAAGERAQALRRLVEGKQFA